jgi:hypothetical protein
MLVQPLHHVKEEVFTLLTTHFGNDLVMLLNTLSRIGRRRATHTVDGLTTESYVASMRASDGLLIRSAVWMTTCLINDYQRTRRAAVLCPDSRLDIAAADAIHDGAVSLCI